MGSIPLPALAIKPPAPPENPVDQYAKILQMQGMKQNQQMQQVQLQQAQQAQQDQQTVRKLFMDNDGNLDKTIAAAAKAGVMPQTLTGLQAHALDVKTKMATLTKDQLANLSQQNDNAAGLIQPVIDAPPEKQPALYAQARASALQNPQAYGITDPSQIPEQFPGTDALKSQIAIHKGGKQQAEDAIKQQAAADAKAKNAAELPGLQATSDQKVLANAASNLAGATNQQDYAQRIGELPFKVASQFPAPAQWTPDAKQAILNTGMTPHEQATVPIAPMMEGRYRYILSKLANKQPVSQEDMTFARAFEASNTKTTTQSDSLGVTSTNTSRPSGLANVGAGATQGNTGKGAGPAVNAATPTADLKGSLVDEIGQYKLNPGMLNRMMVKHPDIIAQVSQKYPDWSQPNYNAANKAITDLAPSGKTGQQLTSYNTFLRHAGALYDAVNSLNNSKYSDLLNKPMNWLAQHTGDPRIADFMAAMQPPQKEFQAFLLNNHAMHEQDVKDAHDLINENKTPQEIFAVLKRFAETGSARLSEQNESFKRVTGRDIPNLVSPQAAAAYNKITGEGGSYTPPPGAQAAVGPNGHKIVVDGGKWVDAQTGKPIQ